MFNSDVVTQASIRRFSVACLILGMLASSCVGQEDKLKFFETPDSFNNSRFWLATSGTVVAYTATVIGLSQAWYADYGRRSFHFQNDWGEWENVDKAGHLFTTYMYSAWMSGVARWTGIDERTADWVGVGTAMAFQTTIEILDGFSEEWGFSWTDMAFNVLGAGAYIGQQRLWKEQRVLFKFSSTPINYPDYTVVSEDGENSMTLQQRVDMLYGTSFWERLLKDYNAQTIWASVNIHSFLNESSKFPRWLNIAAGYGAYNMYGGYTNKWEYDGASYVLDPELFPRYKQYYLSLDVDLTKIKSRSPFVRTLLSVLNVIKIPAPTIEFNRVDGVRWHAIKF